MRIKDIVIHNFKSIAMDCFLQVDENLTTLVGASQSGKTNVLRAIEKFTNGGYHSDDISDFSKAGFIPLKDFDTPMVTMSLGIDDNDREYLRKISPELCSTENLNITRWYSGKYTRNLTSIDSGDDELSKKAVQISNECQQFESFIDKHQKAWLGINAVVEVSEVKESLNSFISTLSYASNIHSI